MNLTDLNVPRADLVKLLGSASGDAAMLYLFLQSGNAYEDAEAALHMNGSRLSCAGATLRQLGLWQPEKHSRVMPGERPSYSETDVLHAMDHDMDFKSLLGEIQRLLGRSLNTEEIKILLGFVRYLGFSGEVICVLICYCKDRARRKGNLRNPSLRTIEKEAYAWSEQGIDTVEEAAAFIQAQNLRYSKLGELMRILQIRGRSLTAGEEKFATAWLEMGFGEDALQLAYERTCLNTGGMNWAYMNRILTRWHEAGLHSVEEVKRGDKKPVPKGASGKLGQAELDAIQNLLKEG